MESFAKIRARAAAQKGGEKELDALLDGSPMGPSDAETAGGFDKLTDDRVLSRFTKHVFSAGFNWKVIESKWDGFEEAFHGFDVGRNAMMSDEDLDRHLSNTAIVRHAAKILSVRDNAIFLSDLAKERGSAVAAIKGWPADDHVGLLEMMKKRGARLGGNTGQYALRALGRDGFILSGDVTTALISAGVVDKAPTSKGAMAKAQEAFNAWAAESGESLTRISRTLAMSVG